MIEVTVYSRSNCHLCEVALEVISEIRNEFEFTITKILIDGNAELEEKYGEQVPTINRTISLELIPSDLD